MAQRIDLAGSPERPALHPDREGRIRRRSAAAWRMGGGRLLARARHRAGNALLPGQASRRSRAAAAPGGLRQRYQAAPAHHRSAVRHCRDRVRSGLFEIRRPVAAGERNRAGAQGRKRGRDLRPGAAARRAWAAAPVDPQQVRARLRPCRRHRRRRRDGRASFASTLRSLSTTRLPPSCAPVFGIFFNRCPPPRMAATPRAFISFASRCAGCGLRSS